MVSLDSARVIRDQPLVEAARVALEANRRMIRYMVDDEGTPIEITPELIQQSQDKE